MKKKINTKNSVIYKSGIMTDLSEAIHYLEHKGYFSDNPDFSRYSYGELNEVFASYHHEFAFFRIGATNTGTAFRYFIPESEVVFIKKKEEEKKLRPFKDIKEFFDETGLDLGKVITYKPIATNTKIKAMVVGAIEYIENQSPEKDLISIQFSNKSYSPDELFKYFLYLDPQTNKWKPFGVEE